MAGRWTLGDTTIDRVLEFERPLFPLLFLFPNANEAALERHRRWLEPDLLEPGTGLFVLATHTFVVRTPRHLILVDTCTGNDKQRPKQKHRYHMNTYPYLERLAALGVTPEQVDYVLCTHLHVDHVGWNTMLLDGRWVPTFPRAKYLIARQEWTYWEQHFSSPTGAVDYPYYEDSILPVMAAGQVELVDRDYRIEDHAWLEPTPGHTPGHVCLHITGGGRDAVLSGDLMHPPVQCAEPDWCSGFCVDVAHSQRTRRAFLDRYAETDALIMPAHFPTPTAGRIERAGDAWRFVFAADS